MKRRASKIYQVRFTDGVRTKRFRNPAAGESWKRERLKEREWLLENAERAKTDLQPLPPPSFLRSDKSNPLLVDIRKFCTSQKSKMKPSSYKPMRAHLKVWRRKHGSTPTHILSVAAIMDTLDQIQKERGSSNATRNRYRYSLFAFFEWARRREIRATNPVAEVPVEEEIQVRPSGCWEKTEHAERYCDAAAEDGLMFRALAELSCFQGPRGSELVALQRQDVDLKRGSIHFRRIIDRATYKTVDRIKNYRGGGGYVVDLVPRVRQALAKWMLASPRKAPSDHLFYLAPERKRGPQRPYVSVEYLRRKHYEWIRRARIPMIRPHGRRHFAVTGIQRAGGTAKDAQILVGHKSAATTGKYTHLEPLGYLAEKMKKLKFGQRKEA